MGILGDAFSAITNIVDAGTGGWWSDSSTKASAKRQYEYNERLQDANMDFQKYMAENAHQMEMEDLKRAGLNPALTTTGSSAGAIAGKSASQGTSGGQAVSTLSSIIDGINTTRMTNAQVDSLKKNADANMINANANMTNAKTNRTKLKGSKEGIIGGAIDTAKEIRTKGMRGTIKATGEAIKDWFSR